MPLVPASITGRRGELIAPAVSYPGEKNGDWYGGAACACDGNRSHSGTQSVTARRDGQSWGSQRTACSIPHVWRMHGRFNSFLPHQGFTVQHASYCLGAAPDDRATKNRP